MSFRTSAPDPFDNVRRSLSRTGAPLTASIIVVCSVLFLVNCFSRGSLGGSLGCFLKGSTVKSIWGLVTYPFVREKYNDFVGVVFSCIWLWFMGSSLERAWGTRTFGFVAFGVVVLTAVSIWLGTAILHYEYSIFGLWLPLAALTVAWATIDPNQTVRLNMILPVPAWALAVFTVGVIYFEDFGGAFVLGLFGLLTPLVAYLFVRGGYATGYKSRGYIARGPDLRMSTSSRSRSLDGSRSRTGPMSWWQDWQERRKLKRLLKNSGFSDRDPKR